MHRSIAFMTLVAGAALAACAGTPSWDNDQALAADSIEMQMDTDGIIGEVEYHVPVTAVPEDVRKAMDKMYPTGVALEAEREYVWSTPYWEVTKEVDGRKVEAMFRPDGKLHSEEIEVLADDVPAAVREAAVGRITGAATWESIHNHKRRLVEYHAKGAGPDGRRYKLKIAPDGELLAVLREVPAEIEVLVVD